MSEEKPKLPEALDKHIHAVAEFINDPQDPVRLNNVEETRKNFLLALFELDDRIRRLEESKN